MKDKLKEKIIDFKFSQNEYQKLLTNIQDTIKSNEDIIQKANQIDLKHFNKKIDIKKLNEIIENYRDEQINNSGDLKRCLIEYNGEIYLTMQLCLWAILNKTQVILDINDFLLSSNTIIVKIVNQELKKYGIQNLIEIYNCFNYEEIKENEELLDYTICIDDMDIYNDLLDYKIEDVKLVKYTSIDLYCDDDELVELRDMICDYARNNHWQLELFDDSEKQNSADIIAKYGEGAIVVLLSNDVKLQQNFKEKITDRKLYINKIPLDETRKIKIN